MQRFISLSLGAGALLVLLGMGGVARAGEPAGKAASGVAEMQRLLDQVKVQRDQMIAAHESLARELREAGEEQRRVILERMQEQKREFEAAQSALHKQIREEQRRQRQTVTGKR
ncbi:MAG: hypothetical protein RLZZ447_1924 [Verrucomicrobiota bacterium]